MVYREIYLMVRFRREPSSDSFFSLVPVGVGRVTAGFPDLAFTGPCV